MTDHMPAAESASQQLALIAALQRNRGELTAAALKRIIESVKRTAA
jgi:hypothetical protein